MIHSSTTYPKNHNKELFAADFSAVILCLLYFKESWQRSIALYKPNNTQQEDWFAEDNIVYLSKYVTRFLIIHDKKYPASMQNLDSPPSSGEDFLMRHEWQTRNSSHDENLQAKARRPCQKARVQWPPVFNSHRAETGESKSFKGSEGRSRPVTWRAPTWKSCKALIPLLLGTDSEVGSLLPECWKLSELEHLHAEIHQGYWTPAPSFRLKVWRLQ